MNRLHKAYWETMDHNKCGCSECEECEGWYIQATISEMSEFGLILVDQGSINLREAGELMNTYV